MTRTPTRPPRTRGRRGRVALAAALAAALTVALSTPAASAPAASRDFTITSKIALPFRPGTVAVDPAAATLYAPDFVGGSVAVVDERTGEVRRRIDVGPGPGEVAVDPTNGDVFATSTGDGTLSMIDRAGTVLRTVGVGTRPAGLVQDPATRTVYVGDRYHPGVSVVDQDTGRVTRIDLQLYPDDLAVDSARGVVYVSQSHPGGYTSASVLMIDTRSGRVTGKVVVPRGASGLAVDPDTHALYATDYLGCVVSVLDVDTGAVRRESASATCPPRSPSTPPPTRPSCWTAAAGSAVTTPVSVSP